MIVHGQNLDDKDVNEILNFPYRLIGLPYEEKGRGPNGFDCGGFVFEVYRRLGIPFPEIISPCTPEAKHDLMFVQLPPLFIKNEQPQPWSIVSMMVCPPYTSHIGVVLPNCHEFIHILWKCNVVIERLDSLYWKNRITGYWFPKDDLWNNK